MTFPAYEQLGKDIQLGYSMWRTYMFLAIGNDKNPPLLNLVKPVEVKVWYLAETIPMSRRKVRSALDWLVARGYLIDHGRSSRGVQALTLAHVANPLSEKRSNGMHAA